MVPYSEACPVGYKYLYLVEVMWYHTHFICAWLHFRCPNTFIRRLLIKRGMFWTPTLAKRAVQRYAQQCSMETTYMQVSSMFSVGKDKKRQLRPALVR